jgi:hypothetical protein
MGTVRQRYALLVPLAAGDEELRFELDTDRAPEDAATTLPVSLTVISVDGERRTVQAEALPVIC